MKKIVLLISSIIVLFVLPFGFTAFGEDSYIHSSVMPVGNSVSVGVEQDPLLETEGHNRLNDSTVSRIIFAPRMNLLVPFLNAGLEVPLGNRFSIYADSYFPWFGYGPANSRCIQFTGVDAGLRYWFNPESLYGFKGNTLSGHSIALGAVWGMFDLEWDSKGRQGEFYGGYVDYSYTFNLERNVRLSLSLGVGYLRIPFRPYTVYSTGGRLIRDFNYDLLGEWIGPVRAGVTLSFPIIAKRGTR